MQLKDMRSSLYNMLIKKTEVIRDVDLQKLSDNLNWKIDLEMLECFRSNSLTERLVVLRGVREELAVLVYQLGEVRGRAIEFVNFIMKMTFIEGEEKNSEKLYLEIFSDFEKLMDKINNLTARINQS